MDPIVIDRTALWNVVWAVLIGFGVIGFFLDMWLLNHVLKGEILHKLFPKKKTEEAWKQWKSKENASDSDD